MKEKIDEREKDIQKLVNAVLHEDMVCYEHDHNNGDRQYCPFCHNDIDDYLVKTGMNAMNMIAHALDCAYLIAKDLKLEPK